MILVLLGTFPIAFKRPLFELERLCQEGKITEEVIVQNGHTQMDSRHLTLRPFIPPDELTTLYERARVIISHAGTGSLLKGIKLHKKVIAIARLVKYGEHIDDHQTEILEEFARLNYILPWREHDSPEELLTAVETFSPARYLSSKQQFIDYLTDYIDSL